MAKDTGTNTEAPLFKTPIKDFIDLRHKLVKLADRIDWQYLEKEAESNFNLENGRPIKNPRLMVGLFLLKYLDDLSDEAVVAKFVENPYYQYFCGLQYFVHDLPLNASSFCRWRKRLGPYFFEKVLAESIKLALREKIISHFECKKVYVDTTVQEKIFNSRQTQDCT